MPKVTAATASPSRARMIAGAVMGDALEFYDFTIYGFFATSIAAAFFPGHDATAMLLAGVIMLATGYPASSCWVFGRAR